MNNPYIVFIAGMAMLVLFGLYISSTKTKKKRLLGTILAVVLALFFGFGLKNLGLRRGIDLQGGSSFRCQLDPGIDEDGKIKPVTPLSFDVARTTLTKRLNPDGSKDLRIVPIPERNELEVQMPGVGQDEIDEVREKIEKVAKLEFRMVNPDQRALAEAISGEIVPGWALRYEHKTDKNGVVVNEANEPVYDKDGIVLFDTVNDKQVERVPGKVPYLVKNRADLSGKSVERARADYLPQGWVVMLNFDSEGAKKFEDLTRTNVGRQFAVMVDDVIISAPQINEAIPGGNCIISGRFREREVRDLASNLMNPLENPMRIVDERTTSATYGKGVIQQGIYAGIAGLTITMLFILLYYRSAGVVALVGLALNVVLLLGVMAMFGATLTMPGIAGLILTIGIAVDANVLIYERLREEMKTGKSLRAAIDSAYDKAHSAIMDANITTLITAFILYLIASDLIKGFAVTLVIGILTSMFAALVLTRVCFSWLTSSGLEKLSFMNLVPEKSFDILGKARPALVISLILITTFFVMVFMKGKSGIGPDFKGGDQIEMTLAGGASDATVEEVEKALVGLNFTPPVGDAEGGEVTEKVLPAPFIQEQNSANEKFIVIQSERGSMDEIASVLGEKYGKELSLKQDSVGPAIGVELAKNSLKALLLGLLAIMLYITLRFEFSFALGALVALIHDLLVVTAFVLLSGSQLTLLHVGALLTIAGYSINDTIVVFDRIREELRNRRGDLKDIMNYAISQTLSRTVLTSMTTLVMVLTLWIFGGPSLKQFSFTIIIGVLVGTYSSLFVASPIVHWWAKIRNKNLRREVLDSDQESIIDPTVVQ